MASNLKDILAKIEQGSSWVSYDKISGTGPDKVAIKVEPGWMGRLPRETYVAVEKGKVTKLATITQKGIERVSVDPTNIMFDHHRQAQLRLGQGFLPYPWWLGEQVLYSLHERERFIHESPGRG